MAKMTLEQAKELADLWRQMEDLRAALGRVAGGSQMAQAYHTAYEIIVDRKENLLEEIING